MNKSTITSIVALVILLIAVGGWLVYKSDDSQNNPKENSNKENNMSTLPTEYANKKAIVQTNKGSFTIEFFDTDAPKAVENFVRLAQRGSYDNVPFHRIIKNFMIQSGDYTAGNGTGGESIWGTGFGVEFNPETENYKAGYDRGVVAMAKSALPNSNGSQFFINTVNNNEAFGNQYGYTIFGKVTAGMDTVDKIAATPVGPDPRGEVSVPTEKVVIEKVTIENR